MKERIWRTLGGLVLIGAGVGLAWYLGTLLIRDFGIGDNVQAATHARLVKGTCKSRLAVVNFCDLTIEQEFAGTTRQTELNYLFVDLGTDYRVRLLSPKGDNAIITTDIGQQMLWNRAMSLAAIVIFCLIGGIAVLLQKGAGQAQAPRDAQA